MANHYGSTYLPTPPVPRGGQRPAFAIVVVALAAVAVCLAAAHSFSATSSRVELAFSSLGLIPFHKVCESLFPAVEKSARHLLYSMNPLSKHPILSLSLFHPIGVDLPHLPLQSQPYPADIDDDRSWGEDDYNALHSYDELGGADNEVRISRSCLLETPPSLSQVPFSTD